MFKFAIKGFAFLTPLALLSASLTATDVTIIPTPNETQSDAAIIFQQNETQADVIILSPSTEPQADITIFSPSTESQLDVTILSPSTETETQTHPQINNQTATPIDTEIGIPIKNLPVEEALIKKEPRIHAKYYSADAIQALPRLKVLASQEPEYNKILFKLENYPRHQEIFLEIKRLASVDSKAYESKVAFSIQDDGTMLISNTDQPLQTLICSSSGFLPGESVFYRFRTADGKIDKEISGIPTPAILKDKDHKIVLKAELASLNPTVYTIFLPTMEEGEEYDFKSTSVGDIIKAKPKYTKNKPLRFSPSAKGNSKGGEAILEIRRKSGDIYAIQLPWGTALESYLQGKKVYSPKP